jgi:hypothetical protein
MKRARAGRSEPRHQVCLLAYANCLAVWIEAPQLAEPTHLAKQRSRARVSADVSGSIT